MKVVKVWVVSLKVHRRVYEAENSPSDTRDNTENSTDNRPKDRYTVARDKAEKVGREWLKDHPHAGILDRVDAGWTYYVHCGTKRNREDFLSDNKVDSINELWAFNAELEREEFAAVCEINTWPDAWILPQHGQDSPLWTTKERAQQALREIEKKIGGTA